MRYIYMGQKFLLLEGFPLGTHNLAVRMSQFEASASATISAHVAQLRREGKKIISLNVGEPDFTSPDYIRIAAIKAITDGFTKYTPTNGILELREAIAAKLKNDNSLDYSADEVTVCNGAKQAIAQALMVVCDPGDEVLIPVPCWVSYTEMVKLAGAKPVLVPCTAEYLLDLDAIERAITPKTKAIVINTPNNPSGAVYSRESLRALGELAVKHDFFIIVDEIYEKLIYDGYEHFSVASVSDEVKSRTITINGFSKAYAMTGWRVGYAAGRSDVIKGITKYQTQMTSSINSIAQKAAAAALLGPQDDLARMVEVFKARRDYVYSRLNAMPGISCPEPHGAFYMLPDVSSYFGKNCGGKIISNAVDFTACLLDRALISVVPGEAYFIDGKVRVSYSNSMENLKTALDSMESVLAEMR